MMRKDEGIMPDAAVLSLGLSPCPNDTHILHALLHGLVRLPFNIRPHVADVEELNALARSAALDATKLSLGVVPYVMRDYALLSSGAALGRGVGPLVVARKPLPERAWPQARVVVPGLMTTANLLLDLHGGFQGERREMLFSAVMPAVRCGGADMGVVIHEGRFTYARQGLVKILDLGEWWESVSHAPLPLGAIAVRRDVPGPIALALQKAIAESLDYASEHPEASGEFVRAHAQEMEEGVMREHIRTFVTGFSHDLGQAGRAAIEELVTRAAGLRGQEMPAQGLFL
ncbi:MAG: 1,4-dihydroxy-6-naphthoate synthase [Desulfovibrio sp.]|jgi:1,4-dihydroxy-6-naphthoate synthase|nr:1,4-dihydroxy-6-naphthoate synthase [Desulfovibrio sp.]